MSGTHHTFGKKLGERMSSAAQIRREERMTRKTINSFAAELGRIKGGLAFFFAKSLWGRLKWIATGR